MGTRHLTAVLYNGECKVAQYGQWDGYPEGAGVSVLEFVRKLRKKESLDVFKSKVSACHWITPEEMSAINDKIKSGEIKDWRIEYPQFSRDTGADILDMVYDSENGLVLQNNFEFAFDHLFCEFVWCIDLDSNVFGLCVGDDKTHTLKPVKTWVVGFAPPTDEFLKAFEEEE